MSRKSASLAGVVVLALTLTACAHQVTAAIEPEAPGFFMGLIHGWLVPFSFIGSIFSDDIAIYAVPNNGGWYDFGFVLGVSSLGGAAASR